MLTQLSIKNFALIDALELSFQSGFTALTGETGAGKSIILDAIELLLGARAQGQWIRPKQQKAEICARFSIENQPAVQAFLTEQALDTEDDCLLRRTLVREGRSSCFINGTPVTAQQLRELGGLLLELHGQHEHQRLTSRERQRELLDNFAAHDKLLAAVTKSFSAWKKTQDAIEQLKSQSNKDPSQLEFLRFQLEELEALAPNSKEITKLNQQQKQLANAEQVLSACNSAIDLLTEGDNAVETHLTSCQTQLQPFKDLHPKLAVSLDLINQAQIHATEASCELRDYLNTVDLDPAQLQTIESRLSELHRVALKHRIKMLELPARLEQLRADLTVLVDSDKVLETLLAEASTCLANYQQAAKKLSASRQKAAKKLQAEIETILTTLNLANGKIAISMLASDETPKAYGQEQIEFQVSMNPGQPLQSLAKVASGGELSRLSLAIEVITAKRSATPTLIFDEVDVGIGGGTAEVVGQLLARLGAQTQVLCVTHLAQVAAQATQQWQIAKATEKNETTTSVVTLDGKGRIEEIARMLGGVKLTTQTRAHAKEMLESAAAE